MPSALLMTARGQRHVRRLRSGRWTVDFGNVPLISQRICGISSIGRLLMGIITA